MAASRRELEDPNRQALLAALQHQDKLAVARLSDRWAHRHGVASLERFIQQLAADPPALLVQESPIASPSLVSAGRAALGFNPIRRLKSLVRDCIDEVTSTFQDGDEAYLAEQQQHTPTPLTLAKPAGPTPRPLLAAPVPLDLADLRSWLPDRQDDQHRRAS
jgi:hypothetical protein